MIIAALLALAVIASLFLIFSNSVQLLRVGLVVALWAATLGAIAMTKYRRESALDKAKVADLQTVYELQLEREISARREYELSVEGRVRREVNADSDELAALRHELVALRRNLEALFDGGLLPERTALKADSTRVAEIGGGSYSAYQPAPSGLYVPGAGQSATSQPAPNVGGLASPSDDPVTAETTVVFADASWRESAARAARAGQGAEGGSSAQAGEARRPGQAGDARSSGQSKPVNDVRPASVAPVAVPRVVKPVPVNPVPEPSSPIVVPPTVVPPVVATPRVVPVSASDDAGIEDAVVEEIPEPRRRRRAAVPQEAPGGAHSNGLTVAEIMANLSSKTEAESSGRRRRRED